MPKSAFLATSREVDVSDSHSLTLPEEVGGTTLRTEHKRDDFPLRLAAWPAGKVKSCVLV